jgi:ferredoxin-NADP reductase
MLFEPGQYASISLHDRLRPTTNRCFSIASSPIDRTLLEFCARVGGEYTHALGRLKEGDEVVVRGPFGSFTLPEETPQDLVFLAGGIGITPFMSMIRYASKLQLENDIHLVFSCRDQDDIPFFEELALLGQQNSRLRVTFVIAGGATDRLDGLEVVVGRLDAATFRTLGLPRQHQTYMICGPSGYIEAMQLLLAEHGVPEARVLSEAFNQGSLAGNSLQAHWPTNMYALSGLSLIAAGLFVVSSDLIQTLPSLAANQEPLLVQETQGNTIANLSAIPPQVDTNIVQEPVITHVPNSEVRVVKTQGPVPAVAPVPAPAPVPKAVASTPKPTVVPTPTAAPKSPPKTKVS